MDSLSVGYLVRFFSSSTSARWMPSLVETLVQHNSSWSASRMSLEESWKKKPNPDTFECWERRCACIHIYFKGSSSCSLAELVLEASEKQGTFPVIIAKHRWNDRAGNCCRVSCWSHPPVCFIYWNAWELFHRWPSQAEQESLFGLGDVVPLGIGSNRKARCWVTQ